MMTTFRFKGVGMYEPDENDYELIQDKWNPEDPVIIAERLYAPCDIDQSDDRNDEEDYYEDQESKPAIPVFKSQEECQTKTERDPFLKVIKDRYERIKDSKLKEDYADFIKKYDTPIKYYVPFFTRDVMNRIWKDKNGQMHSAFYCLDIYPYDLYQLDPKLLIVYAPYFIKKYGFPDWYNQFTNDTNQKKTYLRFIQNNCNKLKLNAIEIKIVQNGYKLSQHNDNYDYCDDYDCCDVWHFDDETYSVGQNGHLEREEH